MSLIGNRGKLFSSLVVLFTCGLVGIVSAQSKKTSAPPKPAQHSAPAHSSNSHSSAPAHNNGGARPNGNAGNRPGANNSRPNNGSMNRPGSVNRPGNVGGANRGTMGNNRGNVGNNNNRGAMGNGANRGGAGNTASRGTRPLPGRQVSLRGGGTANVRPNGQIRSINRNGMQINRGLNGSRTIVSTHNGARVVTTGRGTGYVQRAYVTRGGRTYVSRTVVVNHVVYTGVYRSFGYHGYCCYYGYHPAFFYGPRFYGWAYNPWPAPVYWGWGWGGAPWYGFYGGYFAPYPSYPSAAFWLTDYLISANLQAAYAAQAANAAAAGGGGGGGGDNGGGGGGNDNGGGNDQQANNGGDNSGGNSGQATLTPEVKQAIADEVKAQLAAQQQQSQQGSTDNSQQASGNSAPSGGSSAPADEVPAALDPNIHMFIVSSDLTVNADGQECQLTEGDVLKRTSDTPDDNQNVSALVESSKKSDCGTGKTITVAVNDLQEMHNKFEEQLDGGMKELSSKQGTGGIPQAPDATAKPSDIPPPPADASAAKTLDDQQQAADQTEAQVKEAFNQGS